VPDKEAKLIEPVVRDVMEHATKLCVPLVVDMGFGSTWADAK
jgi:DNA polymerase-1